MLQCDSNIAKQLFLAIFQGIFSQMDESLTDTQADETFTDIQSALRNMMTSSLQYFPPFISCVQVVQLNNIFFRSKQTVLSPLHFSLPLFLTLFREEKVLVL